MTIKRRDLLTGGAGIAAGMAAAGLPAPAQAQSTVKWDREADVVVIGSGASGTTAAIAAREGGSIGDPGRSAKPHRRPRHLQRRQRAARRRHQRSKEMGRQGFARSGVPGSDRLVGRRAERRRRLPLQRSRDHPRLRRQLRGDLRVSARAWRRVRRQGAGQARRHFGRQFDAARDARRGDGLAADPDRQAGRPDKRAHHVDRQRPDAAARRRGAKRPASRFCSRTG